MKTSIINIENNLEKFKESFWNFIKNEKKNRNIDDVFHDEYSISDFEDQWNYIISALSYLIKSHNWFFMVSTKQDRDSITNYLNNLISYLNGSEYHYLISYFWHINSILAKYNASIFLKKDYSIDYEKCVLDLEKNIRIVENMVSEIEWDLKSKDLILENLENLQWEYEELKNKIQEVNSNKSESDSLLEKITWSKEKIDEFVEKIEEREKEIEKQTKLKEEYEEFMKTKMEEYQKKLKDVEELIQKSKQALNYTTAEGISAAIQSQYNEAKESKSTTWWIVLSIIFLVWTGVLMYCLFNSDIQNIYQFISRFSFISLWVGASIFCANQYVKQKNIIEDYAYKLVLAKSIIWFSEELKKWWEEWYQKYITKTLEELLQDPLRNKNINIKDDKSDLSQLKEWIGIMKEAKELLK